MVFEISYVMSVIERFVLLNVEFSDGFRHSREIGYFFDDVHAAYDGLIVLEVDRGHVEVLQVVGDVLELAVLFDRDSVSGLDDETVRVPKMDVLVKIFARFER